MTHGNNNYSATGELSHAANSLVGVGRHTIYAASSAVCAAGNVVQAVVHAYDHTSAANNFLPNLGNAIIHSASAALSAFSALGHIACALSCGLVEVACYFLSDAENDAVKLTESEVVLDKSGGWTLFGHSHSSLDCKPTESEIVIDDSEAGGRTLFGNSHSALNWLL